MSAYWRMVWILFGLSVVANLAWLQRVPGLMGDEGSEGENVYQLLEAEKIVVTGERSYIGPLVDYVRVPFIKVFGYTPLALRLVVVGFSFGAFWLATVVLKRLFGKIPALFGLAFLFFSPIYLTQQRIGWAITLMPFFVLLLLLTVTMPFRYQALVAGLVAGVGLSNHVLFLPTLVGIVGAGVAAIFNFQFFRQSADPPWWRTIFKSRFSHLLSYWPSLVGFTAGFGMQFAVMLLQREDQGDVGATTKLFAQRLADLPDVLPLFISGSSYVARYTGTEFAPWAIGTITAVITFLAICALVLPHFAKASRGLRFASSLWTLGIVIQLVVLMYMVDRYTLRYFVVPMLGIWTLAGVGFGGLLSTLASRLTKFRRPTRAPGRSEFVSLRSLGPIFAALVLVVWSVFSVLLPFLRTGGSTNEFSLGNRTDTAAALVDTRDLFQCLRGEGSVSSENIHILNRLQFVSYRYGDLAVLPEESLRKARWLVQYRDAQHPEPGVLCPELTHFRVIPNGG